jgi:hypothetical protein
MMSPKIELVRNADEAAVRLAGKGYRRWSKYSPDQMYTFITLRALSASPLMIGGDLPTLDGFSLRLVTDPEMLACNQNGIMGALVSAQDGIEVWKAPEKARNNKGWVGVFNRTDRMKRVTLTKSFLGLTADATLYDIWRGRKEYALPPSSTLEIDLNPDGVLFLRYE